MIKGYDDPTTPFERAVAAKVVGNEAKAAFEALMREHGPLSLKRRIDVELERLWQLQAGAVHTVSVVS